MKTFLEGLIFYNISMKSLSCINFALPLHRTLSNIFLFNLRFIKNKEQVLSCSFLYQLQSISVSMYLTPIS